MSEHFRKDAPHYEFSTVRIRLDEWLEDRSSGTLFGPKGCGKDTFLKDYFTPKKNRALAADTNKPTIVLVWEGTTLRHRKDLDDLLACAFQEGFSYLKEQGLIDPALETLLTTAGGASAQSCAQEWKKRRYCFVLVVLGFHNFICNIDGCQADSIQQVNILKNSDAPLRMIVTNDYLYTAQYCPAMEDLAGSSIFNNLSLNQFTFSKNRPRPQEFSQYLGRIYRGGDASPFTPEEEHWLLEMTGGFPAIVPDAAEALLLAKEDGLEGQDAFEDCIRTCMLPEETVYLLLSQWLKDLDDREFEILTQISHFGLSGADEEDVDRPQSVQRGLVYTDRRSRRWRLCIGLLREMLASDMWNPRHTAPSAPADAPSTTPEQAAPSVINYVTNYNISGSVTSTNVQGDLNQVNNNIVVTSREDWSTLFDSVYQLNQGSEGAGRAQLTDSLGKIQYLPEAATEEEATEWFEENGRNMADGLDEMFSGKNISLDDMFNQLLQSADQDLFPSHVTELVNRLPESSALIFKQGVIVDRMFTGLLHSFDKDDQLDFSPCGLMYGLLLEQRMKEALFPFYRADQVIGSWLVNKKNPALSSWNSPKLKAKKITIGNFYGGLDGKHFSNRMAALSRQANYPQNAGWWDKTYRDFARAGDLRNNAAHSTRLTISSLDELRRLVLGHDGQVSESLINRIGVFCQLDARLGYHNPNQISVAQDWQNAVSLHSYTSFPVVSSEG